MGLDIRFTKVMPTEVFSRGITHNLTGMARECGIYECLWRPDEVGIKTAGELIEPLTKALAELKAEPARFIPFESPNGWGTYDNFCQFVSDVLENAKEHPDASVEADR